MCRNLKIIRVFILLFLIFFPALALAQTSIGKFTFVQGRVDVLRQPASRAVPVNMGDAVFVGDIIRAKSKSKAEITFTDGNIVRVAPNTRVEISEYMFDEAKGKGILNLSRGKVQAIIQEKIARRIATFGEANRFEIHTPTAIAGARGCNFIVSFQRNFSSSVFVIEGSVVAYNPKFPDMVVTINTGYIATIPFDQPIQPARPVTEAEEKMYKGDFAPGWSGEKSEAEDTVISEATTGSAEPGEPEPGSESPPPMGALTDIIQPPPITETEYSPSEITPPTISINLSASPETDPYATLNINLLTNEPVSFSYSIDDKPWVPVETPFSFNIQNITEGDHNLKFQAIDTLGNTYTTPTFPFELSRYSIDGSFYGCIAGVSGEVSGEIVGIQNQSWGGWDIQMTGSGGYPNPTWTVSAGGRSIDNIESNDNGYWLLIADGSTDYDSKMLSGTSTFKYLSRDRLGYGEGEFNGSYVANDYYEYTLEDTGLGTYSEKPLNFSGDWGGGSLYRNEEGYFSYSGYDYGLIGLVLRPDNNYDLLAIGEYYDYGYGTAYLWNSDFYADAVNGDGQRVTGFSGGIWKNGTIDGAAAALYIDPDGNAGYLSGGVFGSYHPELENPEFEIPPMWIAEGTLAPSPKTTGLNPEDLQTEWGYLNAHLVGDFNDFGSIEGWTGYEETIAYGKTLEGWTGYEETIAYGKTLFFVKDSEGLPWGIYDLKLGFGNTFSDKPEGTADWSAMIGGQGTFGYEEDNGYWLGKIEGTWTDEGEIRGDLINGKYLTPTQMGTIEGPFFGVNCHSKVYDTWIGESIGTWTGETLAFGGSNNGEFMYWNGEGMSGDGWMQGLMGGTESIWSSSPSFLSLGIYEGQNGNTLWGMDIGTEGSSGWTSNEGAFIGSIGGIALNDNLEGLAIGLYIIPTEAEGEYEAGYIYSDNAIGTLYPGIEMYELGGNLTAVSIETTTISPSELYWGSESLNYSEDYGLMTGNVTGSIVIESANLADQNWGVWRAGSGGTYNITPSESWTAYAEGESYGIVSGEEGNYWDLVGYWGSQTIGSRIDTDNKLVGETTGYFADISSIPVTGILVGETLGTFDPNVYTWQAIQMGIWLETNRFLEMAANEAGREKLQQLNIPCVEVGRATLTGSGNNFSNLNMTDTIFFAPNSGAKPTIWATGNVNGSYSSVPAINTTIGLSGGGLNADFTFKQWDASTGKWLSSINGTGGFNGSTSFQGAGAGTGATSGSGTISGTAAGIAK